MNSIVDTSERQSRDKPDQMLEEICEKFHDDGLSSIENKRWLVLCEDWSKVKDHRPNEEVLNERNSFRTVQLSKARGGSGGARGSGSRISTSVSRVSSGSRSSSSITRFRNTRTGLSISRPNGWLWSRSSSRFLPLATRYFHRSRSSTNRYTTPATGSIIYYYCTSADGLVEIQCSSTYGDSKCCEDQTNGQPICCGGSIPDEYVEDPNRGTKKLAQIFYTLTALALSMHLIQRFRR